MSKTRPNPRLAKIHRNYSVDEIATLFDVHRNTVRAWLKDGLPTIDQQRPLLVLGHELVAFLQARRAQKRRPCTVREIYCMRCHVPREPAQQQVRYQPLTASSGNLVGRCPCCGTGLYRRVSLANLVLVSKVLSVTLPQAEEHINESPHPSVNCDFKQETADHVKSPS